MMHNPLALIALIAYSVAALRILAYRRDGARHRHHVSWFAWLLLVALGGSAIELVIHAKTVGVFEAARAALFSVLVFGARGNVARLLRPSVE
jgi:hypothetical protein